MPGASGPWTATRIVECSLTDHQGKRLGRLINVSRLLGDRGVVGTIFGPTYDEEAQLSDNQFRLPRNVIPVHYDLHLEPDLDTFTFAGSVSIRLGVTETLHEIVLNAA